MYHNQLFDIYHRLQEEAEKELNVIFMKSLSEGKLMDETECDILLHKIYWEKYDALPEETKTAIHNAFKGWIGRDIESRIRREKEGRFLNTSNQ